MFKKISMTLVGATLFSTLSFGAQLNKIVVFGDSLSDNGNLYEYFKHKIPPSPPYYNGRFSNGPVWVEILAKSSYKDDWNSHILDYAFGGAGVSFEEFENNAPDEDGILFSLSREIESYLLSHKDKADENSLFTVWIGSNNYIAALYEEPTNTVEYVNKGIKISLEKLALKGAKHILVINIPDMGKSPAAQAIHVENELTTYSQMHNAALKKNVEELKERFPDVQWILFDADKEFTDVMENPTKYGFTNIKDTCYQSLMTASLPLSKIVLNMASTISESSKSSDGCDGFFFFDPVHPSALTHQVMAAKIADVLQSEGVTF